MLKVKADGLLEFNQVPALEIDGEVLAQTYSIMRYLGQRFGYYPADAKEGYLVDSGLDSIDDIMGEYYKAKLNPDEETSKKLFEEFFGSKLPTWYGKIEQRLKANTT